MLFYFDYLLALVWSPSYVLFCKKIFLYYYIKLKESFEMLIQDSQCRFRTQYWTILF